MRTPVKTAALFALAALATAAACDDTARGVERDAADARQHLEMRAAEAGAEVDEEMREFRRESQATLAAMDQKLDRLERSHFARAPDKARHERPDQHGAGGDYDPEQHHVERALPQETQKRIH